MKFLIACILTVILLGLIDSKRIDSLDQLIQEDRGDYIVWARGTTTTSVIYPADIGTTTSVTSLISPTLKELVLYTLQQTLVPDESLVNPLHVWIARALIPAQFYSETKSNAYYQLNISNFVPGLGAENSSPYAVAPNNLIDLQCFTLTQYSFYRVTNSYAIQYPMPIILNPSDSIENFVLAVDPLAVTKNVNEKKSEHEIVRIKINLLNKELELLKHRIKNKKITRRLKAELITLLEDKESKFEQLQKQYETLTSKFSPLGYLTATDSYQDKYTLKNDINVQTLEKIY